ncbi:hypothetical protein BK746_07890 [Bacillus thuringiensis serovar yosoo]|uniref:Phr family secreted Rap phosphatase inhibitor n=1 Tax=Bacillus thuringiensis serovar yosoo TaxID=180848 RepID=A0A9X6IGK3_BACTU|nr:hypothetical protein [Bacillus thuringiensis]OTY60326.1 hypothetical protein BK746_07890 [Bacillus thuringiensis serovar yosoo]
MKRKIGTAVVGLSVLGFGLFGFTHGNGGGIVQAASEGDGDHHAPSYAHGNHGGAPAYNVGDTPAPKLAADGDHGGAPANTEPGGGI